MSFHLDGEALKWLRWMDRLQSTLGGKISPRFSVGSLNHLNLRTVLKHCSNYAKYVFSCIFKDYITEFRKLANRTRNVSSILLKSCFLGGLKRN